MQKFKILSLKNQKIFSLANKNSIKISNSDFTIILNNFENLFKTEILTKKFDFAFLSKKQRKKNYINLYVGFKITKKIGNAVKRNLIKRQVKSIYRLLRNSFSNMDCIIFIPKKNIVDKNYSYILEKIEYSILKSKKINLKNEK